MGSTILQRTISSVIDQRIVLANSYFARPFALSSWNQLRIAIRASITDSGSNITGTPRFAIGVCSGSTNIFGDASVTNWTGIITTNATLTRFTSPLRYTGLLFQPAKQIGSALTLGGTNISSGGTVLFDATAADRQFIIVDITKGSPNYTFNAFGNNTGIMGADVDSNDFQIQAQTPTPSWSNSAYGTAQTLAVDETAGTFDHVNISWDQTVSNIEISDLAIIKFA